MNFFLNIQDFGSLLLDNWYWIAIIAVVLIAMVIKARKSSADSDKIIDDTSSETKEILTFEDSHDQNEEIIAVIAAAIAMAESENNGLKFRVVSFRRI